MGERLAAVAVNRYPDAGMAELKSRLRGALGLPAHFPLVLGNGSDELIQMISLAVARPGAVVLAAEPSFVMYRMSGIVAGLRYAGVPLAAGFALDEAAMLAAIERHQPALTWLAYPNNPTGNLFPREAILRIAAAAPGLVVVDEAYHAFSGGASLLGEIGHFPNLLLLRTLSKLGLAGLRLGFALGPAAWMDEIEKVRPPYNVNVLTATAAELLLEHHDVLQAQAEDIVRERGRLSAGLQRIAGVEQFASAANFILVRVADAPRTFEALKSGGILVKILHGSHPQLAHCLRLTVGTADENRQLLGALASILDPSHA
jgi:histidinol-phosphate aminotransferase